MSDVRTDFESSPHAASATGLAVRPVVAVLWNGVPLEELGLADSLVSVQFTATVGRTKPTKKYKAGKPKVGGASIEFTLQDPAAAQEIARLLHVHQRPTIAIGFGYDNSPGYWVGGAAVGTQLDTKKFKRIGAFKMDKTTWKYDNKSVAKVTLLGLSDKTISLVEKMAPRVYTATTIKKIFEGIADEHGLFLDIDPELPANLRIESAMKTSHESDWNFMARLSERMGAAAMYLRTEMPFTDGGMGSPDSPAQVLGEIGATSISTNFQSKAPESAVLGGVDFYFRNATRSILRISKMSGFLDLKQLEVTRRIVIGYGANLSTAEKHRCDYLCVDATITDSGYNSGAVPGSGTVKEDDSITNAVLSGGTTTDAYSVRVKLGERFSTPIDPTNKVERSRVRDKGEIPGTQVVQQTASTMPAEIDASGVLASAQLAAIALNNGFTFELQITLSPGVPYLQPPGEIEFVGSDAHDGIYGIEEVTTKWDGKSGLVSLLKCKPIDVKSGDGGGQKRSTEDTITDAVLSGGTTEESYSVGIRFDGKGFLEPVEVKESVKAKNRPRLEPVPAKP